MRTYVITGPASGIALATAHLLTEAQCRARILAFLTGVDNTHLCGQVIFRRRRVRCRHPRRFDVVSPTDQHRTDPVKSYPRGRFDHAGTVR